MEKIFANNLWNKGLISKIHKELIKLNIKIKKKNLIENWQKTWMDIFFSRRHTDGQQIHGKMLSITNFQWNANQNHREYSLTCVRMAIIKKISSKHCWGCGEWECSFTVGGNVNWYSHSERKFLRKLKAELTYDLVITLLSI